MESSKQQQKQNSRGKRNPSRISEIPHSAANKTNMAAIDTEHRIAEHAEEENHESHNIYHGVDKEVSR